jgi:ankyrin repeat protein
MDFFVEPDNIWVAASDGNLKDVQKLIASGVNVNAQDEYGYSPLYFRIECSELFHSVAHADLSLFRHAASSYGEMEVLEYLLSVGGSVTLLDEDGDTPLLVCEKPEIFARLVTAGADPRARNTAGQSIIEKAVEEDNEELIVWLQQNGYITDPNFSYVPGQAEMEEFVNMLERVDEGDEGTDGNDTVARDSMSDGN